MHDIVFDPAGPSNVYTSDKFKGVYRSTDGGLSWSELDTALDNRSVTAQTITADGLYIHVATDVWSSTRPWRCPTSPA